MLWEKNLFYCEWIFVISLMNFIGAHIWYISFHRYLGQVTGVWNFTENLGLAQSIIYVIYPCNYAVVALLYLSVFIKRL